MEFQDEIVQCLEELKSLNQCNFFLKNWVNPNDTGFYIYGELNYTNRINVSLLRINNELGWFITLEFKPLIFLHSQSTLNQYITLTSYIKNGNDFKLILQSICVWN